MSQLTMTGPYVNKTLFEQAKVPVPGPKATWDQWIDATRAVAKATQTPSAMAWDRSGHRFAGPAISNGAKIFDAKGELMLDDGYKTTVTKFVGWNLDGAKRVSRPSSIPPSAQYDRAPLEKAMGRHWYWR